MAYGIHYNDYCNARSVALLLCLVVYVTWITTLVICCTDSIPLPLPLAYFAWSIGQCVIFVPELSQWLTQTAWDSFEVTSNRSSSSSTPSSSSSGLGEYRAPMEVNVLYVQDVDDPLAYLERTYGKYWREKPLLLKGLWPESELKGNTSRRLSPTGLLQMNQTIPYFTDARVYGALEPDGEGQVREVVQRMEEGYPHKIGSQLIVQADPTLLEEVAPRQLVTKLFGDYFSIDHLLGHGKTFGIFPGITTVPVFVANSDPSSSSLSSTRNKEQSLSQQEKIENKCTSDDNGDGETCDNNESVRSIPQDGPRPSRKAFDNPVTGLHCEPIANVAVQLSGSRMWTLVDPEYSWLLRPAISADGRSFYPSWVDSVHHIPRYELTTHSGDAIFVPTWTWHRVDYAVARKADDDTDTDDNNDYDSSCMISIGASLFHFRVIDYFRRNPLFAILLVPAILKEAAGVSTQ
jgi:hypothetical protein